MSTRQKEILISGIAFAIIAGGLYRVMKSTMSTGVPKNSADPFRCQTLYSYPKFWVCGMQQEGSPGFTVDMYVTNKGITLEQFYDKEGGS